MGNTCNKPTTEHITFYYDHKYDLKLIYSSSSELRCAYKPKSDGRVEYAFNNTFDDLKVLLDDDNKYQKFKSIIMENGFRHIEHCQ